jgi:hypothetical protein
MPFSIHAITLVKDLVLLDRNKKIKSNPLSEA